VGRSRDRQPPGRPRDRHQSRQRRDRLGQAGRQVDRFGSKEKFVTAPLAVDGKVIIANGAGDATRGWLAALDAPARL
jgi:hypothetical protein